MLKGYKVVTRKDDKLVSYGYPELAYGAVVEYAIGVRTEPRKRYGPLAVFTKLKDAVYFAICDISGCDLPAIQHYAQSTRLYACEYEPSREECLWRISRDFNPSTDRYQEYKNERDDLPTGSALADVVMLTKAIDISPAMDKLLYFRRSHARFTPIDKFYELAELVKEMAAIYEQR